jgi:uncharacterized protein YeeX (DUF496 family)
MTNKNENVCDKIKYNQSLDQRKEQLLSELEEVNKQIKEQQKECDHISVCIGWCGLYLYRDSAYHKCLICGENSPESRYPIIEAQNYKREIYSHGEEFNDRKDRFIELQNLAIYILNRKPDLSMTQLVEIMSNIVKDELMIKYPDLATNGYFNTEIHTQFKMKKRNSEIESGIELNEEFIAHEIEKYQALLESGIIERVSNEEQVPVKKLVPNENQ